MPLHTVAPTGETIIFAGIEIVSFVLGRRFRLAADNMASTELRADRKTVVGS